MSQEFQMKIITLKKKKTKNNFFPTMKSTSAEFFMFIRLTKRSALLCLHSPEHPCALLLSIMFLKYEHVQRNKTERNGAAGFLWTN